MGAELLGINRTSAYYKGVCVSEEELACKEIIDRLHTANLGGTHNLDTSTPCK